MELALSSPVQYVPRVGPNMAQKLSKLGVHTVEDLLLYAPFRYDDYSLVSKIHSVQPGETVTIVATVESIQNLYTKRGKKMQQALVGDETGKLTVLWFNQPFLTHVIRAGDRLHLSGTVAWFGNKIVMSSPEYEKVQEGKNSGLHTGRLVPVYPETEGLSSKWLRRRIAHVMPICKNKVLEYIPNSIRLKYSIQGIQQTIENIHYPSSLEAAKAGNRRLAFDELFILMLASWQKRRAWESSNQSYQIPHNRKTLSRFIQSLPFSLTSDQKAAIVDILKDMKKPVPANRLLVGDVGSGKTVVAAAALHAVVSAGLTGVFMAPTQILAKQHVDTLTNICKPLGITVELIIGGSKKSTSHTSPKILVGTHALLSTSVKLPNVGLVVIDEQQRFGVMQRSLLLSKSKSSHTPHMLTMTATPIPRTVAQTIYSDLDLSIIHHMPKGRIPVKTWVVPQSKRHAAYSWIAKQMTQCSSQTFIVCPFIEESESTVTVKAATAEFKRLSHDVFHGFRLGLLHGRLSAKKKSHVISSFAGGKLDILVTTPVVEVGIDIPNAQIMVIEGAERFGLSQLHQLRGRVGRGTTASYCLLFPTSEAQPETSRLKHLETTHSGPALAQLDLLLRGPGDVLGTRQHGLANLRYASLSDTKLLSDVTEAVSYIKTKSPDLTEFPHLRERVKKLTIEGELV